MMILAKRIEDNETITMNYKKVSGVVEDYDDDDNEDDETFAVYDSPN